VKKIKGAFSHVELGEKRKKVIKPTSLILPPLERLTFSSKYFSSFVAI